MSEFKTDYLEMVRNEAFYDRLLSVYNMTDLDKMPLDKRVHDGYMDFDSLRNLQGKEIFVNCIGGIAYILGFEDEIKKAFDKSYSTVKNYYDDLLDGFCFSKEEFGSYGMGYVGRRLFQTFLSEQTLVDDKKSGDLVVFNYEKDKDIGIDMYHIGLFIGRIDGRDYMLHEEMDKINFVVEPIEDHVQREREKNGPINLDSEKKIEFYRVR